MDESAPSGTETKEKFLKRLKHIARILPRKYVKDIIDGMKANIQYVIDARRV